LLRSVGSVGAVGHALVGLGLLALQQRENDTATRYLEEALALYRTVGNRLGISNALGQLGLLATLRRDYGRARACFGESLTFYLQMERRAEVATCLDGLAGVALGEGRPELAARLFGAGEAQHEAAGQPLFFAYRAIYERSVAAVRRQLGERTLQVAWAAGRALALDDAIAEATQPGGPTPGTEPTPIADQREGRADGLSAREAQILHLVAAGRSNREIAEALVLSVRTVETHVARVYGKIGATNRAEAAAYAVRQGIAP
jgi:non-specific serine/threonine protein kinase